MKHTAIFPGRYVQQAGGLRQLGDELVRLGDRALIIGGQTACEQLVPQGQGSWSEHLSLDVERFGGESSQEEIDRLADVARSHGSHVIVAMGGGKAIDTAKAVGHAVQARVAIVPTIASTDAPTSAVSVIYRNDGSFERYLFLPRNPDLVLVDSAVIAAAPVRFLIAGMGDALATWFEADSCRTAFSENQCGGLGTLAGNCLARLCFDTILEHGVAAKTACEQNVVTPQLEHVVEANTLLSGLGFESGGLATAHSIHNGLTQLEGTHDSYHGEKVAIGVLASLFLTDKPSELIDEVYEFCEAVQLPTTLDEIGIGDATDDDLQKVAEAACVQGETIHHEPFPVTPDAIKAALRTADAVGKQRLMS